MGGKDTWMDREHPDRKEQCIAYFCAEYGFHESFPIYSGGLGILAGDHLKTASDMGLNFVAVGLFYTGTAISNRESTSRAGNRIYTTLMNLKTSP